MRPSALLLLTLLTAVAQAEELPPAPVIGSFKGSGSGAGVLLAGRVSIAPGADGQTVRLAVRGEARSSAPRAAEADGAWAFQLNPGTLAGLEDHLWGGSSSAPVVLRLTTQGDHVEGAIVRGDARLGSVTLRRTLRALVLPQFDGDDDKDTTAFRAYGRQVARYYQGRTPSPARPRRLPAPTTAPATAAARTSTSGRRGTTPPTCGRSIWPGAATAS
jgi:hypothetical protein